MFVNKKLDMSACDEYARNCDIKDIVTSLEIVEAILQRAVDRMPQEAPVGSIMNTVLYLRNHAHEVRREAQMYEVLVKR